MRRKRRPAGHAAWGRRKARVEAPGEEHHLDAVESMVGGREACGEYGECGECGECGESVGSVWGACGVVRGMPGGDPVVVL